MTPDATARTETADALTFTYTNWRGQTDVRFVDVAGAYFHFGATEWHGEPQWLLRAHDRVKAAFRDFAVRDIRFASPQHPVWVREALEEALELLQEKRHGNPARSSGHNAQLAIKRALATLSHPPAQDAPGADWRETERNDYVSDAQARDLFGTEDDEELPDGRVRVCDGEWVRIPGGFYFDASKGLLHPETEAHTCFDCTVSIAPSPPLPEADGEVVAWMRTDLILGGHDFLRDKHHAERCAAHRYEGKPAWTVEPLVRQSALVSALRERDEARALEAHETAIREEACRRADASEAAREKVEKHHAEDVRLILEACEPYAEMPEPHEEFFIVDVAKEALEAAREKAEQVAAGLREALKKIAKRPTCNEMEDDKAADWASFVDFHDEIIEEARAATGEVAR